MGFYPIFVEMAGRRCVVIGGGEVAERKVMGLLETGAEVTVVSPELTADLRALADSGSISHIARRYASGDLSGCELTFVASGDPNMALSVFQEGKERGLWVNAADDPAHCDFILPSVLRRGDLTVAVATGGKSPALSRAVRGELERYFSQDYAVIAEVVGEVRSEIKRRSFSPPAPLWQEALSGEFRRLIKEGKRAEARSYLLARLGGSG